MSPSSLIFVAVVVIWATYLVVHVARRREHLATARTVDRFSDQMRVLQRRAVRLDPPTPSSVRVSSAGIARPRPLVAQAGPDLLFLETEAAESAAQRVQASVLADAADPYATQEPDFFTERPSRGHGLRLPTRRPGSRQARALRGAALLVCVALLAGAGAAAAVAAVPWWALILPALAVVGVFAWLRAAARSLAAQRRREAGLVRRRQERERRAEQEAAQAARPSAPRMPVAQELIERPTAQAQATSSATLEPVAQAEAALVDATFAELTREELARTEPARNEPVGNEPVGTESVREPTPVGARRLGPLEVAAMAHTNIDADRADRADRRQLRQNAVDPLTAERGWEPMPVPPPTYTLKAKASRPMPEPLEVPVPIEVDEDDVAWDEVRHQPRIVSA